MINSANFRIVTTIYEFYMKCSKLKDNKKKHLDRFRSVRTIYKFKPLSDFHRQIDTQRKWSINS